MSNQIFCTIDLELCAIVKEIAGDNTVIDCGAGRGMFGSMYDGRVISIDIHEPEESLSPLRIFQSEHFCFPIGSIPLFIRPCHSGFVHETIVKNTLKIDKAIYIGLIENLDDDLDLDSKSYSVSLYDCNWVGKDGEKIWVIDVFKPEYFSKYKTLCGKILHVSDPMLSYSIDNQMQEFNECVELPLFDRGILVDGKRVYLHEYYPHKESFDYMFFDWGGMSIGNSMMEDYCRLIATDAKEYPSRIWVVVSSFTSYAMEEAINEFGNDNHNIFTSIDEFAEYFNNI